MIPDIDATAAHLRFMLKYCDRWCYFGGSSSSSQHQVSSNQINPAQMQQYQQNYTDAQNRVGSLTPYQGQITAGFNPTQTQAQGVLSGIATNPTYAANNNAAISSVQGILGANPNTTVTAQPYTAGQLSNTDLSPYMNPFTNDVINASVNQNEVARQKANVTDNQAATAAGAFGGSRSGVANALTNQLYDQNDQTNIANLNQANYGQAQSAAQGDIASRNAASQFNSAQGVNAQQSSIQNALAQAGFKVNAAGQLEQLNQGALQTAAQQGGILSAVGDAQQAQQQTELTNAYNAYLQGQQLTVAQQQLLNQALSLIPLEQTNTTDGTTTTKSNPGIGGILGGVASLGLAAATGGTSLGLTGALGGLGGLFGNKLAGQSSGPSMGYT